MTEPTPQHSLVAVFIRDYGMVFVLLLLVVLFSALTLKWQHPTGADAGRQVAALILQEYGAAPAVLVVGRDTAEDRLFTAAAAGQLTGSSAIVLATVNGSPADVRTALERIEAAGKKIDAIAANDVTAKWTVYNAFPTVGATRRFTPNPYRWPDFLKLSNLTGVANQTAIYAIIAIGMTMVIITAGIDLSVGSLVALSSVCAAMFIRDYCGGREATLVMSIVGGAVGIGVCALAGALNGAMVTLFRLPSFIVTLAVMKMASGLSFRLPDGRSIPELPQSFLWLGGGDTVGIPNPILLMALLYLVAHILMSRTIFGRYVYAIGGNQEAARLSGVPVRRILMAVYIFCGALAGLGGIMLTSQLAAGDPKFGRMYELEVIAAVVVGGTSLMGGQGRIFGTLIGAFIIAVIRNGMNLTDVHPFSQDIVLGAVLLGAVLLDTVKRRGLGNG